MKYMLEYQGQIVALPEGESLVGRARGCRLRFSDLTVSRLHCRLTVADSGVTIEDLGSQSGTVINDAWLREPRQLQEGDSVQIGNRQFRIRKHRAQQDEDTTVEGLPEDARSRTQEVESLPTDLSLIAGMGAASHERDKPRKNRPTPTERRNLVGVDAAESIVLDAPADLPNGLQRRPTMRMQGGDTTRERRRDVRVATEIQALYASDELTFRGVVRDVSTGGMFIASDVLDPPGTTCSVSLFPEGECTVRLTGIVRHVVKTAAGSAGRPPGVGIQFIQPGEEALQWVNNTLARSSAPLIPQGGDDSP